VVVLTVPVVVPVVVLTVPVVVLTVPLMPDSVVVVVVELVADSVPVEPMELECSDELMPVEPDTTELWDECALFELALDASEPVTLEPVPVEPFGPETTLRSLLDWTVDEPLLPVFELWLELSTDEKTLELVSTELKTDEVNGDDVVVEMLGVEPEVCPVTPELPEWLVMIMPSMLPSRPPSPTVEELPPPQSSSVPAAASPASNPTAVTNLCPFRMKPPIVKDQPS